jgi:flagellar biosynthesis protein
MKADYKKNTSLRATALAYEESFDSAPRVAYNGTAEIAQEIVRTARRYGVPIQTNKKLSSKLASLAVDSEVPELLYEDVAAEMARSFKAKE